MLLGTGCLWPELLPMKPLLPSGPHDPGAVLVPQGCRDPGWWHWGVEAQRVQIWDDATRVLESRMVRTPVMRSRTVETWDVGDVGCGREDLGDPGCAKLQC